MSNECLLLVVVHPKAVRRGSAKPSHRRMADFRISSPEADRPESTLSGRWNLALAGQDRTTIRNRTLGTTAAPSRSGGARPSAMRTQSSSSVG